MPDHGQTAVGSDGEPRRPDPRANAIANKSKNKSKNTISNTESLTIKSESEVKYSSVIRPTSFALPLNTNLNLAPSNWLNDATESYGVQHMSTQSGFSSFQIADKNLDCINKVDIVSDAENIKQLLKIPFSKKSVSMMVHRVGDTLLIDEFNASQHLVVQTENKNWNWLKKFFSDHIFKSGDEEKYLSHRVNSFNVLQKKTLNSKFLHYSIANSSDSSNNNNSQQKNTTKCKVDPSTSHCLPQPYPEVKFPDHPNTHNFNQTMLWTFGDVKMLIGSDLPIFKHGTCSSQSLRLKDSSKPINILTKIDYWLDNLMCNVSEVVLCHHRDGIVQKYEKVKTEELPKFEETFIPQIFKYIANNLLSFLKSKVSKVGHTYWLYKGKNENMITTYDLTSLCFEPLSQDQNPFTVPIAMLLYRVAHSWLYYPVDEKIEFSSIKSFLSNSLKLLKKKDHPLMNTSINFMLSELYIPVDFDKSSNILKVSLGSEDLMDQNDYELINSTDIFNLCILHNEQNTSSESEDSELNSVELSKIERCHKSFFYIGDGLQSLRYIIESKIYKSQIEMLDEPNIASSSSSNLNPIVTKIDKKKPKGGNMDNNVLNCPFDGIGVIWQHHFRGLLLQKAVNLVLMLSFNDFQFDNLGNCLKLLHLGVECQLRISNFSYNPIMFGHLFQQGGNCFLKISQSWNNIKLYNKELENVDNFCSGTIDFLEDECNNYSHEDLDLVTRNLTSKYHMLAAAEKCYKRSLEYNNEYNNSISLIAKDVGAVSEQYIIFNIDHMQTVFEEAILISLTTLQSIINVSLHYFLLAIDFYKRSSVIRSQSILYLNMGVLYSLASVYVIKVNPDYKGTLDDTYGKKAIEYFNISQKLFRENSCNIEVWNYCCQNTFTCYYTLATRYISLCTDNEVKDVDSKAMYWLKKSMIFYNMIKDDNIRNVNSVSVATIANKLGDLYFKQLQLFGQNHPDLINILKYCCEQYDIAYDLFIMIGNSYKALEMLNRKLFFEEYLMTNGLKSKIECCLTTIQHLEKSTHLLYKSVNADECSNDLKTLHFDPTEFFVVLEQRLGFVLRHMTKISMDETSVLASQSDKIKTIYFAFIQKKTKDHFTRILETIKQVTEMKFE